MRIKPDNLQDTIQLLEVDDLGMVRTTPIPDSCCGPSVGADGLAPPVSSREAEVSCCGSPPPPRSDSRDIPGYRQWHFVTDFVSTPAGQVPQVATRLKSLDYVGATLTRIGLTRNNYLITPGLYCVGHPDQDAPVLVTANYKLTFDAVRKELGGLDAWILVLDTRGINVWCAAGKELFSDEEVVYGVKASGLEEVVSHRVIVLPQLAANGVSAREVKRGCGFTVKWGPVRASDIRPFLGQGMEIGPDARRVTFSFTERVVLVPIELHALSRAFWKVLLALFILSGIGMDIFSLERAWPRTIEGMAAFGAGIIGGAVLTPILLPWLKPKFFSLKGLISGLFCGIPVLVWLGLWNDPLAAIALVLFSVSVSSYLALNFTGATPFTSPSGVEKEMRLAIPAQAGGVVLATMLWVYSGFTG